MGIVSAQHTIPAVRLGVLTPSSNSVLEPRLGRMAAALPDVSVHFARFPVTEIALSSAAPSQFDDGSMLAAAELLADARVASICWNGTWAGWLGFDRDRALSASIEERTGIPAGSSVPALDDLLRRGGIRRIAFVTPYTDDVQARIVRNFASEGYECVAEQHTGQRVNFAFSEIPPGRIAAIGREVAGADPDAIVIFCTNMWGALIAPSWRQKRAYRCSTRPPLRSGAR